MPKDGVKRIVNEIVVRHCHVIAQTRGAIATGNGGAQNRERIPDLEGAVAHDGDWPVQ